MGKIEKKEVVGNIVAFTTVLPDLMDFRNSKLQLLATSLMENIISQKIVFLFQWDMVWAIQ